MSSETTYQLEPNETLGTNITRRRNVNYNKFVYNTVPWPVIITAIVSSVFLITTGVLNNNSERKLFGIIFFLLWGLLWCILLGVLWREKHYTEAWFLMIIPLTMLTLFFILVIVLDF